MKMSISFVILHFGDDLIRLMPKLSFSFAAFLFLGILGTTMSRSCAVVVPEFWK